MFKFYTQVRTVDRANYIRDTARMAGCEVSVWHTPRGGETRHVHIEGDKADLQRVIKSAGIRENPPLVRIGPDREYEGRSLAGLGRYF